MGTHGSRHSTGTVRGPLRDSEPRVCDLAGEWPANRQQGRAFPWSAVDSPSPSLPAELAVARVRLAALESESFTAFTIGRRMLFGCL